MTSSTSSTSYALSTSSGGLASISGLSSGIDTSSLVQQFMQLEALPQTKLKSKLVANQAQTSLLQSINAKIKTLTDSATKMSLGSTTGAMKATTSDDKSLTASVTGSPAATSLTIKVTQTAAAASGAFTGVGGTTSSSSWMAPNPGGPFALTLTANGKVTSLTPASYSIDDVAAAINGNPAVGVSATVLTSGDGSGTGAKSLILTAASGNKPLTLQLATDSGTQTSNVIMGSATAGADAQITVNGIAKSSSSNTFADLIPGLSVTIAPTASTSAFFTVGTMLDASGASTGVKSVVDALASVLADLKLATTAPSSGTAASITAGGLFAGDSTLRGVYSSLISTVVGVAGNTTPGETLADAGIEANTNGTVSIDSDKLTKYLTSNPALAQKVLTNFGTQLSSAASLASITGSGTISSAIISLQSSASDLTSSISAWDGRLAIRQKTLTAQYTAMETALSKIQSQTSALTAALKQLDSNNSK